LPTCDPVGTGPTLHTYWLLENQKLSGWYNFSNFFHTGIIANCNVLSEPVQIFILYCFIAYNDKCMNFRLHKSQGVTWLAQILYCTKCSYFSVFLTRPPHVGTVSLFEFDIIILLTVVVFFSRKKYHRQNVIKWVLRSWNVFRFHQR